MNYFQIIKIQDLLISKKTRSQINRIMKLTCFILFTFMLQISATTYSQNTKLDVFLENVLVKDVFKTIESQSEFRFFYSDDLSFINKKVTLNMQEKTVEEILAQVLDESNLTYRIFENNLIVVTPEREANQANQASQAITVTGTVSDADGPLPGVSVRIKGTTSGTATDMNGRYSINVPDGDAVLQFSFIGYLSTELTVGSQTVHNVTLREDTHLIEEVVVIGYGSVSKRNVTGSISTVSASQMKDIPVTSVAIAMQGKMAGVDVTQTEGAPGAEIMVRVRGGGSITQDNSPLYIIDGFPVDNMNAIAPADIASITVLKDASSTAIYGARGANGVVLITTKSCYEGKITVSYNMYYGTKKLTKWYDVMSPYDYVLWQLEIANFTGAAGMEMYNTYYGVPSNVSVYKGIQGTNWQKELMGNTGTSWYNNLSVSGGNKSTRFNISLTRNDNTEIMASNGYTSTGLLAKINTDVNNWLSVGANIRLHDEMILGAGTNSGGMMQYIRYRPIEGLSEFVEDEQYLIDTGTQSINPLLNNRDMVRRRPTQTFSYNGEFTIRFPENITYRFQGGYQYLRRLTKNFDGLNTGSAMNNGWLPLASIYYFSNVRWNETQTLTYNKKDLFAPGHDIEIMAGQELSVRTSESFNMSVRYLPKNITADGAFAMMNLGSPNEINSFSDTPNNLSSFFGRLFYSYQGKYLLNYVIRADGSSKFAPGNRWGIFNSGSLAWRISDEKFMKPYSSWLSDLKLRGSIGETGNNNIGDDMWRKSYSVSTSMVLHMNGPLQEPTMPLVPATSLANPDLKWETTITRNIGLDFTLWQYRLNGVVEYYNNITKDLLISATIPSMTGYTTQMQNIGQTSNRGIEITLDGEIIQKKDFRLSASFNIAFNKARIDKLGESKRWTQGSNLLGNTADYLIEEGGRVGLMYGYQTDGMYSFDDFELNEDNTYGSLKPGIANSYQANDPRGGMMPGVLKFVKQPTADGSEITNWEINVDDDKIIIGDAMPIHTGGFSISSQYKGFDFTTYFNWKYGNDIYNANKLDRSNFTDARFHQNLFAFMSTANRFYMIDEDTGLRVRDVDRLKVMNEGKTMWIASNGRTPLHSWVIEDGSFLRLNNMTLGYSLPKNLLSKLRIDQLRVYVTAFNLWTWTNYSGYDPEVNSVRSTPLTPGIDYNAYPKSRSYNFGLNLNF